MNVCNITWNPETDVVRIGWSAEFVEADWLVRADVLRELSFDMTEMYTETLKSQIVAGRE